MMLFVGGQCSGLLGGRGRGGGEGFRVGRKYMYVVDCSSPLMEGESTECVSSLFRVSLSLENPGIYSFTFNVYANRRNEVKTCSKVRCFQLGQSKRCVVNARSRAGWWRLTYSACEVVLGECASARRGPW